MFTNLLILYVTANHFGDWWVTKADRKISFFYQNIEFIFQTYFIVKPNLSIISTGNRNLFYTRKIVLLYKNAKMFYQYTFIYQINIWHDSRDKTGLAGLNIITINILHHCFKRTSNKLIKPEPFKLSFASTCGGIILLKSIFKFFFTNHYNIFSL